MSLFKDTCRELFCSLELTCFRFGDTIRNDFYLNNTYTTRSRLVSAIRNIGYRSLGSGRNIEAVLNALRTQQFTTMRVRCVAPV